MADNLTVWQRLTQVMGNEVVHQPNDGKIVNSYSIKPDDVLFQTSSPEEYHQKALELRQQHLLAKQWRRANYEIENRSIANLNNLKMMYRDAELMDNFPEIGTALDIAMEEACFIGSTGKIINVYAKSDRIKSILDDLFVNRLSVNTILPMVCRSMCKYGNNFMLLNLDTEKGVKGWKQLPVYEMERFEDGMDNPYATSHTNGSQNTDEKATKFVWVGSNTFIPYQNWQVAHFRLLYDNMYLPYGCSFLNKARRHFRMLSMMEDMMLIYRLERSIERRVFKINVGAIDDADVPAYVQQIADNFKRTPIVDPMTGQIDLRKNILCQQEDFFIPTRDDNAANPIETLPAAQNLTAMDDIKFVQNKVLTALRVPKPFLNFEETTGDGKNLSLLDVRFTRTVNRIQQALLMELNKIAIIHLYLLGMVDELTDFTLTMNNPSSQAEMLELENLAKKITTAKDAITDSGNGIPLMSVTRAQREILKWSDKEIEDNLEELRLEKAMAVELEKTSQIITKTGLFDKVDNIYGDPDAEYSKGAPEGGGEMGGPGGGGGMPIGGDMDFGDDSMPDEMENGAEEEMSMEDFAADEGGNASDEGSVAESHLNNLLQKTLNEQRRVRMSIEERGRNYAKKLKKRIESKSKREAEIFEQTAPLYDKSFLINEEMNDIARLLGNFVDENTKEK